jgi:mannosyl-oligosaccharide alpha-1,3-glucosidase
VTDAGKTTVEVYLPGLTSDRRRQLWYDLYSMTLVGSTGPRVTVNAPLEKIPVFVRGGKVVPRKMRLRRSSKLMFYDPYTLSVCPDSEGNAVGQLYMDDEYSTAHKTDPSAFVVREFVLTSRNKLSNRRRGGNTDSPYEAPNTLERVIVAGQMRAPTRVAVVVKSTGKESSLPFFYDESSKTLSIKKPDVLMTEDWDILFSY